MRGLPPKLFAVGVFLLLAPGFSLAHFTLIAPQSSLQTEDGGKGAPPCGEGLDSNFVTQVQGGHPLAIRISEFVFHPGHYRFALSVNSRAELPADPEVVESNGVSVSAAIQNPPKIPVLADGVFVHTEPPAGDWQTSVVLPNLNCEKCTLQVIEFMAEHGANIGGGFYYHHCADLKIMADPNLPAADPAWPRADLPANQATGVFSHLADGGGWQTSITLVNLDLVPAAFIVKFWGDNGTPLAPSPAGSGQLSTVSGMIAVGGSRTIQSDGSPPATSMGWAQVSSAQAIGGTAIFRSTATGQEAAVPLLNNGSTRLLFPFDNNSGLTTGIALAAPAGSAGGLLTLRNQQGQTISAEPPISVPANGHAAFLLPARSTQPQDLRGVAEFTSSNAPIFGLGIRSNQGAFTSVDAVMPEKPSTKTITHIADGGSWKTTIILVNSDTAPASFTLNCWKDDGTALPVLPDGSGRQAAMTGTIPAGGTQTIETSGLGADVVTGWAEVLSGQPVGGTAIFRLQSNGQEAAVPLLSSGGRRVVLPFERGPGLALGIALANTDPARDATITVVVRDEQGTILDRSAILLGHHQHTSFVLEVPAAGAIQQRGVVEFDSPTVDIFALGIRSNNGAFTSIRALSR